MITFDTSLRVTIFVLFAIRFLYWTIAERRAHTAKPKTKPTSFSQLLRRIVTLLFGLIIALQLLGLEILPFQKTLSIQLVGFFIAIVGVIVSVSAREELGANWLHLAEYELKKDHELVTSGIYAYIRHPIYAGMSLSYFGTQLVVGSYFLFIFLLVYSIVANNQAKKEEKVLIERFGSRYKEYMKKTKMFIPYIW